MSLEGGTSSFCGFHLYCKQWSITAAKIKKRPGGETPQKILSEFNGASW